MTVHQEKVPDGSRPSGTYNPFTSSIISPNRKSITAEMLAEKMGLIREGREYKGHCPRCGYNRPTLSVSQDGDRILIYCHACQGDDVFQACINQVSGQDEINTPTVKTKRDNDKQERVEWARRLYEQSQQSTGTLVETYLISRGFNPDGLYIPDCFRFHPNARYDKQTSFPAIMAPVTMHDGTFKGIQRIFCRYDGQGKADVASPKKSLGDLVGASVHLAPAENTLGLCEGIETGLAAMTLSGEPIWACLSTAGLINVVLPPLPLASRVIIFADNDRNGAGLKAAREASHRFIAEGRQVTIQMPDETGTDYCDLMRKGE